jgi:hypothetical protein
MSLSDWFTTTAQVYRLSGAIDDGGAQTFARSLNGEITGHAYTVSTAEQNLIERFEGRTVKKFLCPLISDVTFSDKIIINGDEFDVIGVTPHELGANSHLELLILQRGQ